MPKHHFMSNIISYPWIHDQHLMSAFTKSVSHSSLHSSARIEGKKRKLRAHSKPGGQPIIWRLYGFRFQFGWLKHPKPRIECGKASVLKKVLFCFPSNEFEMYPFLPQRTHPHLPLPSFEQFFFLVFFHFVLRVKTKCYSMHKYDKWNEVVAKRYASNWSEQRAREGARVAKIPFSLYWWSEAPRIRFHNKRI